MAFFDLRQEASFVADECVAGDGWTQVDTPSTGAIIGRVARPGAKEDDRAAAVAMVGWSARAAQDCAEVMWLIHDLLFARRDDLAALLTLEQRKPIKKALAEIDYAASYFSWFAGEGRRTYGRIVPSRFVNGRIMVLRQPVSVVGVITQRNFSAAMVTRKAAAGFGMVLKLPEHTPFNALAIARLGQQEGVPYGFFSVVTGKRTELGGPFMSNPKVRKISIIGSTEVGKKLFANSAPTIKKLSLERGGKAGFILFDDADLDAAVAGAIAAKFRNAGQTCVRVNRFFAYHAIHGRFVALLCEAVRGLAVVDGNDPAVTVSPLIDSAVVAKVESHVPDAIVHGGSVLCGGRRHSPGDRLYGPTVIADVTPAMCLMHEETFGPDAPSRYSGPKAKTSPWPTSRKPAWRPRSTPVIWTRYGECPSRWKQAWSA